MTPLPLDQIEALALLATAGGREAVGHALNEHESMLFDDDGDVIATGRTADVEFWQALDPVTVVELVRLARKAGEG